jgi:hypothetical protein
MSAWEMHLNPSLAALVRDKIATPQEAWQLQDAFLVSLPSMPVLLPPHLWALANRMSLYHAEAENKLPL